MIYKHLDLLGSRSRESIISNEILRRQGQCRFVRYSLIIKFALDSARGYELRCGESVQCLDFLQVILRWLHEYNLHAFTERMIC